MLSAQTADSTDSCIVMIRNMKSGKSMPKSGPSERMDHSVRQFVVYANNTVGEKIFSDTAMLFYYWPAYT